MATIPKKIDHLVYSLKIKKLLIVTTAKSLINIFSYKNMKNQKIIFQTIDLNVGLGNSLLIIKNIN